MQRLPKYSNFSIKPNVLIFFQMIKTFILLFVLKFCSIFQRTIKGSKVLVTHLFTKRINTIRKIEKNENCTLKTRQPSGRGTQANISKIKEERTGVIELTEYLACDFFGFPPRKTVILPHVSPIKVPNNLMPLKIIILKKQLINFKTLLNKAKNASYPYSKFDGNPLKCRFS